MNLIYQALVLHWVGDFVLQSNWMAKNKATRLDALLIHVAVYALPLCLIGWQYAIINACAHLFIDFFTSKATKRLWDADNVHYFFVVVGLDQLLHTLILIGTLPS